MYLKLSDGACDIFTHIYTNIHMTGLRYGYITGRIFHAVDFQPVKISRNTIEMDETRRSNTGLAL